MLWLARFTRLNVTRTRAALALSLIAAAACADRVANPTDRAATQRALADFANTNPFDDLWVAPYREVNGGEAVTGTISLRAPAEQDMQVVLTSANTDVVSVDNFVLIPAGATSQTFHVQTYPVPINLAGNISGVWNGWTVTSSFLVKHVDAPPPPPPQPILSVSPGSLTFGQQAVGTTSPPQNVTVRNTGTGNLLLGPIGINGPFQKNSTGCPGTLYPGYSCNISVTYVPTTGASAQSGSLSVTNGWDQSHPQVVILNGTPTPTISLTTGTIGFGSVALGNATSARVVKITSIGTAPLVISSLTLGGTNPGDFPMWTDGCTGATLNPGASCTAQVSFEPLGLGTRTATITILHNAPGGPKVVSLSGTGVKPSGGWVP